MAWLYLLSAGILEIILAYYMKLSDGFTRFTPSVITLVTMIASFGLLSLAMRSLPLGTALYHMDGDRCRGCLYGGHPVPW